MYQARDIRYGIGRREILRGVDFAARPGEVTVIVGPNGSGKSTLLKALTGEIAAEGEVSINGKLLSALRPWQSAAIRDVLPQSSVLTFPFSVHEVVRLGLSGGVSGLSENEAMRWPDQALARVDPGASGGGISNGLPGGDRKR